MTSLLPEDQDLLAAEYVLGTLDLPERLAAEARIKADVSFAAAVEAWQERLADLNADYAEAPAPDLMPRIEARLFPQAARPSTRGWLTALLGFGLTTAAALAVVAFLTLTPAKPSFTAELSAEDSPLRYAAAVTSGELTLTRLQGSDAAADRDYELWLIEGDKAPVSLGVLGASYNIALPKAAAGYVLAITLEPKGGAPEGKPTGPIVAAGPLKET
ncbi:MAG: anti-sigma factor [Cypionkella sp.]|jgi:anti-sigma-K factor RskA